MINCFFTSDLHGKEDRYEKLFLKIREERPAAVFLGGDLLPHGYSYKRDVDDFVREFLADSLRGIRDELKSAYPEVFLILGNDDPRVNEKLIEEIERESGVWRYVHMKYNDFRGYRVFGYAMVPPTPFRLKDWEKYDVSRYVDPGCIHPTDGFRSVKPEKNLKYATIKRDLESLTEGQDLSKSVFLFHSPPYNTSLDRASLNGQYVDHVPLDVHVGSIAIQRFIEERQPLLSMHGHIHESSRITGQYSDKSGRTIMINGATDSSELCLIRFDLENPATHNRELI